ncbi:MAG: formylglycine-generating enzyme family protein [Acholeplasmataceae bacterium]|nr:formylglycine-generating enzyme family protein [Acholeplasmataceae bacterium]
MRKVFVVLWVTILSIAVMACEDDTHTELITYAFVTIGDSNTTYIVPQGIDDEETVLVEGGYQMANTETTYALWTEVRLWALDHGYVFENQGTEGFHGEPGASPTNDDGLMPVIRVSWRDVIVWTNAYSEKEGLDPVYRRVTDEIIKDATSTNRTVVDSAIQTNHNGYRLPTTDEWEMAARWLDGSGDYTIEVGGRFWTKGDHASGALADTTDSDETNRVAWLSDPKANQQHVIGQKAPNQAGLYDMSGNAAEWTYTVGASYQDLGEISHTRVFRGGAAHQLLPYLRLGRTPDAYPYETSLSIGFRLVRS